MWNFVREPECYNTVTGQWTSLAIMPHRRTQLAVTALANRIYVIGGLPHPGMLYIAVCQAHLALVKICPVFVPFLFLVARIHGPCLVVASRTGGLLKTPPLWQATILSCAPKPLALINPHTNIEKNLRF